MKFALQVKGLWEVVSGHESCPLKPPAEFLNLMTLPCPREDEFPKTLFKEEDNLMKAVQSKEFLTWKYAHEKYKHWLIKDDSAIGII